MDSQGMEVDGVTTHLMQSRWHSKGFTQGRCSTSGGTRTHSGHRKEPQSHSQTPARRLWGIT